MSLLLDALKKAAEKKAKKAAGQSSDETACDKTEQVDAADSTMVSTQEVDATRPMTDFHSSRTEDETLHLQDETTRVDVAALDSSDAESTLVDSIHAGNVHDDTLLDSTRIDATQVDATQIDADATRLDAAELDKEAADRAEDEASPLLDTTQMEAAELAQSALHENEQDEDDTIVGEGEEIQIPGNTTVLDRTQTMSAGREGEPVANLTEDDVTEFMGDGHRGEPLVSSDDTTITNSDSLTLTSFGYTGDDPSLPLGPESTESDTFSLGTVRLPDQTSTETLKLQRIPEDDKPTLIRSDSTATTGSQVDIEKLTSDETVTVEGRTSTRTFAPDNYDRTLINMSDKDVSRIFPGMKTESDAVMTPDYAKKVFLSKSGRVKAGYYKWYAGLALVLLLAVVLYGMFQLVDESEVIDQRLASLKRDPMPGVIKPKETKPEPILFSDKKQQADIKTAQILAQVPDELISDAQNVTENEKPAQPENELQPVAAPEDIAASSKTSTEMVGDKVVPVDEKSSPAPMQPRKPQAVSAKSNKPADHKASSADSRLTISSRSQPSRKAQVLMSAYEAYQRGDIQTAASQYDQALALDPVDRDALLGRAAVHIQQNEYQQAINLYQKLLEQNPKDSMAMTSLISVANIDPQAGESQLKSMLGEQPDSPFLHFVLGNMYGSQGRWNEAQQAYFNALTLKPQDADYAYNLAVSLDHIGQKSAAAQYYRRALDFAANSRASFDTRLAAERLEVLTR